RPTDPHPRAQGARPGRDGPPDSQRDAPPAHGAATSSSPGEPAAIEIGFVSVAWLVPFVAIGLTQIAIIATSIYLHRALAHRSLHLHPVAEVGFRVALWLTTGLSRQQWVAVHRKHHTFTDRQGDPHS